MFLDEEELKLMLAIKLSICCKDLNTGKYMSPKDRLKLGVW